MRFGAVGNIRRPLFNHGNHRRAVCRLQKLHILLGIKPHIQQQVAGQQIRRSAVPVGVNFFALQELRAIHIGQSIGFRSSDHTPGVSAYHSRNVCAAGSLNHLHIQPLFGEVSFMLRHIHRQVSGQMKRLGNNDLFEAFACLGLRHRSGGFFPAAGKGGGNQQGQGQYQRGLADAVKIVVFVEVFSHRRIHPFSRGFSLFYGFRGHPQK
ncbi:hypothetical protein D3C76_1251300 [compost metagenome]